MILIGTDKYIHFNPITAYRAPTYTIGEFIKQAQHGQEQVQRMKFSSIENKKSLHIAYFIFSCLQPFRGVQPFGVSGSHWKNCLG